MPRITDKADLTHGTEFTLDYSLKTITLAAAGNLSAGSANGVTGTALLSAIADYHKSGAGVNVYRYFLEFADGPLGTMLQLCGGWTFAGTSITFIRNTGVGYFSDYGGTTLTDAWACFAMLGTVKTATDQPYYLINGTTPANFGVADEFNECIKVYESGSFDYRSSPTAQFFTRTAGDTYLGYDLISAQSISALTYRLYQIPGSTVTDSAVSVTGPTGLPYSGMTLTLGATTNTINAVSYNFAEGEIEANGGTVQQVYDWYQNLLLSTSDIDSGAGTQRGDTYLDGSLSFAGGVITTSQGLTIKNIAVADASNIVHTDDTGTGRQQASSNSTSITNLPTTGANIRLQVYNVTTATEIYNDDPASATYSDTYTEGGDYTTGDSVRVRFAEMDGATSFKTMATTVTAGASGWAVDANNFLETDSVYGTNAINGSTVSMFTADFVNDEIDLSASANFTAAQAYGFFCYTLTTALGIDQFWGGVEAADVGNYKILTATLNLYFDNTTTASHRQTDSARIYRDDDAYPVKDPTTSAYGIDINWKNVVYVVSTGGSALTAGESAQLMALPTAGTTANAVWDEAHADHTGTTTFGGNLQIATEAMRGTDSAYTGTPPTAAQVRAEMDSNSTQLAAIVADTADMQPKVGEIHKRSDLDAAVPQTYNDDGSVITNDNFTLTKTDNGNGTFTIVKT